MTENQTILNGRYKLKEILGAGAFATVYQAHDQLLDRPVAVKLLDRYLVEKEGPALAEQFIREAKAVAKLNHPHIVHVYDVGQEDWQLYLVMELLPGGDLAQKLADHGPYDLPDVLALLAPIAQALDHAHAQGMVHRDVKPQNILFRANGRPVLTDFGLVKLLSGTMVVSNPVFSSGKLLGTPEYMAPEQAQSQSVDARTDVYALAVVAFELLTGDLPFQGDTAMSTLFLVTHVSRADLIDRLPDHLTVAVRDQLLTGLAIDPAARPATATGWLQQLNAARQQGESSSVPIQKPVLPSPKTAVTIANKQAPLPSSQTPTSQLPAHWRRWAGIVATILTLGCLLLYFASIYGGTGDRQSQAEATATSQVSILPPTHTPTTRPTNTPQPTHTPTTPPTNTPRPTNTPTPQAGDVVSVALHSSDITTEMVYIPAGPFMMGSESEDAWDREKPVHEARTGAYWLDRTSVTNAQFAAFVSDTNYETTAEIEGRGRVVSVTEDGSANWDWVDGANWPQPHGSESDWAAADLPDHPVVQVSWHDATAFCEWRAARLPTETEWEKAARGTDQRIYPWGDEFIGTNLNYCDRNCPFRWRDETVDDGHTSTSPVGSYPAGASPYGVLDMAGNVWEWTDSWFMAYPGNTDEDAAYGETFKVLRGGSWDYYMRRVRSSNRDRNRPDYRSINVGFRCASSAP